MAIDKTVDPITKVIQQAIEEAAAISAATTRFIMGNTEADENGTGINGRQGGGFLATMTADFGSAADAKKKRFYELIQTLNSISDMIELYQFSIDRNNQIIDQLNERKQQAIALQNAVFEVIEEGETLLSASNPDSEAMKAFLKKRGIKDDVLDSLDSTALAHLMQATMSNLHRFTGQLALNISDIDVSIGKLQKNNENLKIQIAGLLQKDLDGEALTIEDHLTLREVETIRADTLAVVTNNQHENAFINSQDTEINVVTSDYLVQGKTYNKSTAALETDEKVAELSLFTQAF